jgi:putative ABC transport system permease protein
MRDYRKTIRNKDKKIDARVVGVMPNFFPQNNIKLLRGRAIDQKDESRMDNTAVIGAAAAEILFPAMDPLGKSVSIEDLGDLLTFTIIGVSEDKSLATGSTDSSSSVDFSKVLFIPFSTDRVRFGEELISIKSGSYSIEKLQISQITVAVDDVQNVPQTAEALQSVIQQYHPDKDVVVVVPLELLEKAEKTQQMFTLILAAIAGISLVVGGIGIMNIMLATVTERTREIGIRRALGAKQRDIAAQFLVETLVLSGLGGAVGIILGVSIAYGLSLSERFGVPTIIRLWSPILAFSVSMFVGLVSGSYPARRAARLDPIEALRHS